MIEKSHLESSSRWGKWNKLPLLSFLSVLAAFCIILFSTGVSPFGERSVLISDLSAQYAPYLITFRNKLLHGDFFSYSFEIGMGKGLSGIFAYYASSPLNLLVLFFPVSHISEAIVTLIALKLAFSGAFMTAFLNRRFRDRSSMSILFGVIYALSSFPTSFLFNFIWLDGFMLLPLVLLITEIVSDDICHIWKLFLVLVMLFFSGYYMAYMVGIFSFLYLLISLNYKKTDHRRAFKTVGLFVLTAVLAAMVCAALLLPAGLDTLKNSDKSAGFSLVPCTEFSFFSLFPQFFIGKLTNISTNMPFLFSSLSVLMLVILLFLNPKISKRLKVHMLLCLGAGILSFWITPFNIAWQLFDDPNGFLYRHAYLFIAGTIIIAYYSFLKRKTLRNRDFGLALLLALSMLAIAICSGGNAARSMFVQNLSILLLETACLWGMTKEKWIDSLSNLQKFRGGLLLPIVLVEIVILAPKITVGALWNDTQASMSFSQQITDLRNLTSSTRGNYRYRLEQAEQLGENIDSLTLSSYTNSSGIGAFFSMSNKNLHHYLKQLGYCTNYNYFSVEHRNMNLPSDSILSVHYIVSSKEEISGLQKITHENGYSLFSNPYALDPVFLAEKGSPSFDGMALEKATSEKDYFAYLNDWIASLSGITDRPVYDIHDLSWDVQNATPVTQVNESLILPYDRDADVLDLEKVEDGYRFLTYYSRTEASAPIVFSARITVEEDGPLFLCVPFLMHSAPVSVFCNGEQIYKEESTSYYSVILDLGSHRVGEGVDLEIRCPDSLFGSYPPKIAYCDLSALSAHTDILKSGITELDFKDGHVSFDVDSATEKALLSSIPFEEGWSACVDGQEVQVQAYQDAFLCVSIPSGHHHVEFTYTPPGQKAGLLVSLTGLLLSLVLFFLFRNKLVGRHTLDRP